MLNVKRAARALCAAGFGLVSALCAMTAPAATPDDDFLAAREAFRVGDVVRFERAAKSLSDYPLEPYIAYWRLRMRLEQATPEEVQALLARIKDGPAANSLRTDWLKLLANRQQWEQFDAEYAQVDMTTLSRFLELQGIQFAGTASGSNRLEWPSGRWAEHRGGGTLRVDPPAGPDMPLSPRSIEARDRLPMGVSPTLGPVATAFRTALASDTPPAVCQSCALYRGTF